MSSIKLLLLRIRDVRKYFIMISAIERFFRQVKANCRRDTICQFRDLHIKVTDISP